MYKIYCIKYRVLIKTISILLISLAISLESVFAACTTYTPSAGVDQTYLKNKTMYGYVLSNLDLSKSTCQPSDTQMQLYLLNDTIPHTFQVGKVTMLSSLGGIFFQKSFDNIPVFAQLMAKTNQVCLIMDTIYGDLPLVCQPTITNFTPESTATTSSNISCFQSNACTFSLSNPHSKVLLSITGSMIECVRDSMNNLFFAPGLCLDNEKVNTFSQLTDYLRKTIGALLTIYLISYAIKILLDSYVFGQGDSGFSFSWSDAILRIVKILLVVYFTIGTTSFSVFDTQVSSKVENGMVDIVLPLLQKTSIDLAVMLFNSTRTNVAGGLCQFDLSSYDSNYTYYALFDAIDCRISYYLGYGLVYNSLPKSSRITPNSFAIFKVVSSFILTNPILVIFNVVFIYLFLQVLLVTFVGSFIVYSIMLCIMVFLSPLFVPLVLFEKTKSSFTAWMNTTLSFALQPAIIGSFIAIILSVYDQSLYGDCVFTPTTYQLGSSRSIVAFDISSDNTSNCTNTYGYKMYQYYSDQKWRSKGTSFFSFDILGSDLVYVISMLRVVVISFLIYQLTRNVQKFAASLTGGLSIDLTSPASNSQKNEPQNNGQAKDTMQRFGQQAKDTIKRPG